MARRRAGDASVGNDEKKEEETDTYHTVYIDTNLDTHIALVISQFDSVLDLKKKVKLEHLQCFPKLGEIIVHALKVKRKGNFYHLSDSMRVNRAFEGVNNSWFLSVDASYLKQLSENEQSCRPNMSAQSPVLCLPYNLTYTECNNDDASTSAVLKSASVEHLRNQKLQLLPGDSCREFSEDIVTKNECSGTEILKNVSADLNRVPDLQAAGTIVYNIQCSNSVEPSPEFGFPVKKKKQKIGKHNVDELGVCLAKENLALNQVSGGDAVHHEILRSANVLVHAEKAESKGDALLENMGLVCNSTQKTSKQETTLPEDQYNNQVIAANTMSPESSDSDEMPMSVCTENMKSKKKGKRHEMKLSSADNHEKSSFPSKQETILPEDQNNNQIIAANTISPESTDSDEMPMNVRIENMKSKKKRKRHEMNLSSADNLKKSSFPLCVEDSSIEDRVKEKNITPNHATGEVLSPPEIIIPSNLLVITERKEHKEIGDPLKESELPVSTSKEEFDLQRNSEEQNNSMKMLVDTLSSEPVDNQHLRTSPGIKSKRSEKKRKKDLKQKKDVTFNLPSAVVLPSFVQDAGGEESFQEKNIASNHISGEDESHHEAVVSINMAVNAVRTEHEGNSGDSLKENKFLVSTSETCTQEIGLTKNSMEDQHYSQKIVVDTLSSAAADNELIRTETNIKSKKNKKKRKTDAIINTSNSIVLPSSAKDAGGAESLNDKKVRDSSEQDKNPFSSSKKNSTQGTGLTGNTVEDQHVVVSGTLSPEPAESEQLRTNSSIKHKKSKKKSKRDKTLSLSSAIVLPSCAQDVGEETDKEKNIALNNVSGKDESHPKIDVPANLLVNTERTEHGEFSGYHLEQNKGTVSKCKNTSVQEIGLKENSVQDQDNSQKVLLETLSPELADSEHLGTNSNFKKMKKKSKRKIDATVTLSSVNLKPSSVQDAAGEESLKKKNIPLHEDESHHEIIVPVNLLVNAERPEREEIIGNPLEKDKVGSSATTTSIGLNLDSNTAPISKNDDLANVQSANMIKDKSRKGQANFITPSQPTVSESGSDRIDFKHYFLQGKAEDKVAGSGKKGITRPERDDKTKKSKNNMTASLITSHDQALTRQSSKNQEGGVKSHIKCSSDIDPQESFSKDASIRSLRPSKKSTSNVYQKGLPTSSKPDQARTHSVLRASGRGVSANSTHAPAYRKGKKVSSAASSSSSSSESFDKSHQGTKTKNHVSNSARRLVACAKSSAKITSEGKSTPLPRKNLLTTPGSIFQDDSSESSDDEGASEQFDARTRSDDVLSSDSDRESDISLDSPAKGSSGLDKKEDVENIEKKRSLNLRNTTIDMILRRSSRYKKAKLTAESQPEVEDSESQPVDCVPDSQANP